MKSIQRKETNVHTVFIILISMSWWWLLKPKRSISTLHHDIFTYLDIFFCYCHTIKFWSIFTLIYIYIYIFTMKEENDNTLTFLEEVVEKGIFVSASHQTGHDTRSMTRRTYSSGDLEERKVAHEPRLEPCWSLLVRSPLSAIWAK